MCGARQHKGEPLQQLTFVLLSPNNRFVRKEMPCYSSASVAFALSCGGPTMYDSVACPALNQTIMPDCAASCFLNGLYCSTSSPVGNPRKRSGLTALNVSPCHIRVCVLVPVWHSCAFFLLFSGRNSFFPSFCLANDGR